MSNIGASADPLALLPSFGYLMTGAAAIIGWLKTMEEGGVLLGLLIVLVLETFLTRNPANSALRCVVDIRGMQPPVDWRMLTIKEVGGYFSPIPVATRSIHSDALLC